MKIDFSFSGYVVGAEIEKVSDGETGEVLDVTNLNPEEVLEKLNNGEYLISLGDYLYESRKNEIEIFDFEVVN